MSWRNVKNSAILKEEDREMIEALAKFCEAVSIEIPHENIHGEIGLEPATLAALVNSDMFLWGKVKENSSVAEVIEKLEELGIKDTGSSIFIRNNTHYFYVHLKRFHTLTPCKYKVNDNEILFWPSPEVVKTISGKFGI